MNRALIVGIGDYWPRGKGGPDLRAPKADAKEAAAWMRKLGIVREANQLLVLLNADATREAMLDGFAWLMDQAYPGDVRVFYYSGHGTQVKDASGDEDDQLDEAICPHDASRAGFILDDDLRERIERMPHGVLLEIILDACHAGTGTRARGSRPPLARFWPPRGWPFRAKAPVRRFMEVRAADPIPHVLWAASLAGEVSFESWMGLAGYRGRFTRAFFQTLAEFYPRRPTRAELADAIAARLAKYRPPEPQTPALECTSEQAEKAVFVP